MPAQLLAPTPGTEYRWSCRVVNGVSLSPRSRLTIKLRDTVQDYVAVPTHLLLRHDLRRLLLHLLDLRLQLLHGLHQLRL